MKIENPVALRFVMQDDLYLLNSDKLLYANLETPQPIIETQPVSYNYLGEHKKKFLVMVHYAEPEFIADDHLTALKSIFKRMELGLDDVAIFNRAKYIEASFEDIINFFGPRKLLLLGKLSLPDGIPALTINQPVLLNSCNTLFSYGFEEMMNSTENKKAFWEQVKQL